MSGCALKADVDRQTARQRIKARQPPEEVQGKRS
jgi:hypothetical protein